VNQQIRETFTRGVGLARDIGTIVAVTHHSTASSGVLGTFYVHNNSDKSRAGHRGDVIVTRSTGGATVGTYDYSTPRMRGSIKSWPASYDVCRFKFSSKEREPACGFYYYGYRFYAPQWQRWIRRDPIGEHGSLNLYVFVGNRPMTGIDQYELLFGMPFCCVACIGFSAWQFVDIILDATCAGKRDWELVSCVAEKMLGGCVGAALLTGLAQGSAEEAAKGIMDCWKCDVLDAIRDTGQVASCLCCLGVVAGAYVKDIIIIIRQPRMPLPKPA